MNGAPEPVRKDAAAFEQVQRRVASAILLAIAGFAFTGLVAGSAYLRSNGDTDGWIGMLVIGGLLGLACSVGVRLIYGRRGWSPWVLVGPLPALIAGILIGTR